MSFSWICLRFDLYSFSSSVSSLFCFSVSFSPFSRFVSLTASLLFTTVSNISLPKDLKPSMFITASMAAWLPIILRKVSLSTFTKIADCHFLANKVADVPAIAISRIPPASTWVIFDPSYAKTGKNFTSSSTATSGSEVSGESPAPYSAIWRRALVGAKSNTKHTGLSIASSWGLSPLGFLIDQGDWTLNAAWK